MAFKERCEYIVSLSAEERAIRAKACGTVTSFGHKWDPTKGFHGPGPALQASGDPPSVAQRGAVAETFKALAEGLAILALQPGGVNFMGEHWEVLYERSEPRSDADRDD